MLFPEFWKRVSCFPDEFVRDAHQWKISLRIHSCSSRKWPEEFCLSIRQGSSYCTLQLFPHERQILSARRSSAPCVFFQNLLLSLYLLIHDIWNCLELLKSLYLHAFSASDAQVHILSYCAKPTLYTAGTQDISKFCRHL